MALGEKPSDMAYFGASFKFLAVFVSGGCVYGFNRTLSGTAVVVCCLFVVLYDTRNDESKGTFSPFIRRPPPPRPL